MTTEPTPSAAASAPAPKPARRSGLGQAMGARINRKVYALWAGALIAVTVGVGLLGSASLGRGVGIGLQYVWIMMFTARLHDLGRSGWWQVLLYAAQVALMLGLAFGAGWQVDEAAGLAAILQFVATIALGLIPGQRGPNRFGPAPGEPATEAVAETFG